MSTSGRKKRRNPYTKTVVRLPERTLSESLLHLAAPVLEALGPAPTPDEVRGALELAVNIWNAQVMASPLWGTLDPKRLAALRKAMCGKPAQLGLADTFERMSERWRAEFSLDPRLVGEWSFELSDAGRCNLVCEAVLPEGIHAHVPPPAEKRIAIGGKFLDEVSIRLTATSYLSFPVDNHRADVSDGLVTIHARMPTVVQLFAEGALKAIGGEPVEIMVGGKKLGPMQLGEVRCGGQGGHQDVAVLVLRPAKPGVGT